MANSTSSTEAELNYIVELQRKRREKEDAERLGPAGTKLTSGESTLLSQRAELSSLKVSFLRDHLLQKRTSLSMRLEAEFELARLEALRRRAEDERRQAQVQLLSRELATSLEQVEQLSQFEIDSQDSIKTLNASQAASTQRSKLWLEQDWVRALEDYLLFQNIFDRDMHARLPGYIHTQAASLFPILPNNKALVAQHIEQLFDNFVFGDPNTHIQPPKGIELTNIPSSESDNHANNSVASMLLEDIQKLQLKLNELQSGLNLNSNQYNIPEIINHGQGNIMTSVIPSYEQRQANLEVDKVSGIFVSTSSPRSIDIAPTVEIHSIASDNDLRSTLSENDSLFGDESTGSFYNDDGGLPPPPSYLEVVSHQKSVDLTISDSKTAQYEQQKSEPAKNKSVSNYSVSTSTSINHQDSSPTPSIDKNSSTIPLHLQTTPNSSSSILSTTPSKPSYMNTNPTSQSTVVPVNNKSSESTLLSSFSQSSPFKKFAEFLTGSPSPSKPDPNHSIQISDTPKSTIIVKELSNQHDEEDEDGFLDLGSETPSKPLSTPQNTSLNTTTNTNLNPVNQSNSYSPTNFNNSNFPSASSSSPITIDLSELMSSSSTSHTMSILSRPSIEMPHKSQTRETLSDSLSLDPTTSQIHSSGSSLTSSGIDEWDTSIKESVPLSGGDNDWELVVETFDPSVLLNGRSPSDNKLRKSSSTSMPHGAPSGYRQEDGVTLDRTASFLALRREHQQSVVLNRYKRHLDRIVGNLKSTLDPSFTDLNPFSKLVLSNRETWESCTSCQTFFDRMSIKRMCDTCHRPFCSQCPLQHYIFDMTVLTSRLPPDSPILAFAPKNPQEAKYQLNCCLDCVHTIDFLTGYDTYSAGLKSPKTRFFIDQYSTVRHAQTQVLECLGEYQAIYQQVRVFQTTQHSNHQLQMDKTMELAEAEKSLMESLKHYQLLIDEIDKTINTLQKQQVDPSGKKQGQTRIRTLTAIKTVMTNFILQTKQLLANNKLILQGLNITSKKTKLR